MESDDRHDVQGVDAEMATGQTPDPVTVSSGTEAESPDGNAEPPKKKAKKEKVDYEALIMAQLPEEMRKRSPLMTIALVAASTLMLAVMWHSSGSLNPSLPVYKEFGANYPMLSLNGQWWRFFTSSFLHFGFEHFACNMVCLFSLGVFLEKLIGHRMLFCVYFLTALSGSLLSSQYHVDDVCAGASGAVFGVFGASVAYVALRAKELQLDPKNLMGYMRNSFLFLGINFIYSLAPGIDMLAHVGGFIGGLVIGVILALPYALPGLPNVGRFPKLVSLATRVLIVALATTWCVCR